MSQEQLKSPEIRIAQLRLSEIYAGVKWLDAFDLTGAAEKQQAEFSGRTETVVTEAPKQNMVGQMAVETEANSATDARMLVEQAHAEGDDKEYDLAY